MAMVINHLNATSKPVKNLGWILRNWRLANYVTVTLRNDHTATLYVHLRDDRLYQTTFQSQSVCLRWIDRPVFRTLGLRVIDLSGQHGRGVDIEGGEVGGIAHHAAIYDVEHNVTRY